MQLPIQSGVRVRDGAFEVSYPVNLEHRVTENGLSKGQLVSTQGVETWQTGPGVDRGAITWRDVMYRVMGDKLVTVARDGAISILGTLCDDNGPVSFTYSFDRLAIRCAEKLFYWDGLTVTQVTDDDLGRVLDVDWIDGYFVTTDGEFVVVTELLDPAQVDGLKYGSAESDPDPVTGVIALNEELYAIGRHSIQVFQNVGGLGFPFQNVRGAALPRGCVSADAKCRIASTFAFVGGGRDEPIGVFLYSGGTALRISTREIDRLLSLVEPETIRLEARNLGDEEQLVVHLDTMSLAISLQASSQTDSGAWHILHSGNFGPYRPRNAVNAYGRLICGDRDSAKIGTVTRDVTTHFGDVTFWRFDVGLTFNEGLGIIIHDVEMFGVFPKSPSAVFMSMTRDGEIWSNEVSRRLSGKRDERAQWRPNVRVPVIAGMRFRGSDKVSAARVDVRAEPLMS